MLTLWLLKYDLHLKTSGFAFSPEKSRTIT